MPAFKFYLRKLLILCTVCLVSGSEILANPPKIVMQNGKPVMKICVEYPVNGEESKTFILCKNEVLDNKLLYTPPTTAEFEDDIMLDDVEYPNTQQIYSTFETSTPKSAKRVQTKSSYAPDYMLQSSAPAEFATQGTNPVKNLPTDEASSIEEPSASYEYKDKETQFEKALVLGLQRNYKQKLSADSDANAEEARSAAALLRLYELCTSTPVCAARNAEYPLMKQILEHNTKGTHKHAVMPYYPELLASPRTPIAPCATPCYLQALHDLRNSQPNYDSQQYHEMLASSAMPAARPIQQEKTAESAPIVGSRFLGGQSHRPSFWNYQQMPYPQFYAPYPHTVLPPMGHYYHSHAWPALPSIFPPWRQSPNIFSDSAERGGSGGLLGATKSPIVAAQNPTAAAPASDSSKRRPLSNIKAEAKEIDSSINETVNQEQEQQAAESMNNNERFVNQDIAAENNGVKSKVKPTFKAGRGVKKPGNVKAKATRPPLNITMSGELKPINQTTVAPPHKAHSSVESAQSIEAFLKDAEAFINAEKQAELLANKSAQPKRQSNPHQPQKRQYIQGLPHPKQHKPADEVRI